RAAGLDVQTMLDSISQGASGSWQMNNMAPRMIKEDYEPGFFIKHYIKDMKIALEESDARKLTLPILTEVLDMYRKLDEEGMGDLGTQALIKYYEEQ
ncbi:MAG: NAD-binding protein, partial [Blautia coccoides]